jgi:hypothetical protein
MSSKDKYLDILSKELEDLGHKQESKDVVSFKTNPIELAVALGLLNSSMLDEDEEVYDDDE